MSKKDFNQGLEEGIKFSKKILEETKTEQSEIRKTNDNMVEGIKEIKEIQNIILDIEEKREIKEKFGVNLPEIDKKLEKEEQILAIQLINQFKNPNERQKEYKRELITHLGLNPKECDESLKENSRLRQGIKNIDSREIQKIIYQLIIEFLYLNDSKQEKYSPILSCFSINENEQIEIKKNVEKKIRSFGIDYLIKTQFNEKKEVKIEDTEIYYLIEDKKEYIEINKTCAQKFFDGTLKNKETNNEYIETSSFIVYPSNGKLIALNKETYDEKEIFCSIDFIDLKDLFSYSKITSYGDIVYLIKEESLLYSNLEKSKEGFITELKLENIKESIFIFKEPKIHSISVDKEFLVFYNRTLKVYNLRTKEYQNIMISQEEKFYSYQYILKKEEVYFINEKNHKFYLYSYNLISKSPEKYLPKEIAEYKILSDNIYLRKIGIFDNYVYMIFSSKIRDEGIGEFYYVDLNKKEKKINRFGFSKFFQIEQYKNFLIYNKTLVGSSLVGSSVVKYDFLKDKEKVIPDISVQKYRRIGKWIFNEKEQRYINIEEIK